MEKSCFKMLASVLSISQVQPSDIFLTVRMRMFSTRPNLNNEAVTEAFIDEIVANQDKYICLPLCADTSKLVRHDFRGLGHMYNRRTGRFLTQYIGSFNRFEKVEDEFGISLVGEARVAKRQVEICEALEMMYERGDLNFSFEITASKCHQEDGITYVDADEGNYLQGMAVVSIPAYPEAKALALVAELEANEIANAYEHATISMSELSFDKIQEELHRAIWEALTSMRKDEGACLYFQEVYPSRAIVNLNGNTYAVEYMIDEAMEPGKQVVVKEFYEVEYQRKEGEIAMTLEEAMARIAELEAEVANVTKKAEEQEDELKKKDQEKQELDQEMAKKDERCAELETKVSELTPYKEQVETIEAEKREAELAEKKEKVQKYAEKNALDLENEDVKNAIAELNYEALVTMVAEKLEKETEATPTVTMASFTDITTKGDNWLFQTRG